MIGTVETNGPYAKLQTRLSVGLAMACLLSGVMASPALGDSFSYVSLDFPGAQLTQASGINASGQIVGVYIDASGQAHGFLDSAGSFSTLDFPGALATTAFGINGSGETVGYYVGTDFVTHGFLATPLVTPEPGTLTLVASALVGLACVSRFRRHYGP